MNQVFIAKNEDAKFELPLSGADLNSGYAAYDGTESPVEVHLPGTSTVVLSTANAGEVTIDDVNQKLVCAIAPAKSNNLSVGIQQIMSVLITKGGKTYVLVYSGKLDVKAVPNP